MAMIHINRNRETLGKFNDQEVADGLKTGRFLPTDLAWSEPMPSWQPLATFNDLPEPSSEEILQSPVQGLSSASPENIEPAWERTTGLSLSAAIETVKQVFSNPKATFQKLPPTGGFGRPLFFYTLVGWISGGAAIGYQLVAASINPAMLWGEAAKGLTPGTIVGAGIIFLLFLPLFLIAGAFIWAAQVHLFLMITGASRHGFGATLRALAYTSGATSLLQFFPLCGGYLYLMAHLIFGVIALKEVHQTDLWRVVVSMVLMVLLCCGLATGILLSIASLTGQFAK